MSDRYFALTVLLDREIRDDDAQPIIDAIKMVKGVAKVEPHVSDVGTHFAVETARRELGQQLLNVIYPDRSK